MKLGENNFLRLARFTDFGPFLEDKDANEVLLPNKFVTEDMQIDDELEVFVYTDSEDRIVATTQVPFLKKDDVACLEIKEVTEVGAFADWGLDKDLFIPFREQRIPVIAGNWYNVYLGLDNQSGRMFGSTKLRKYLSNEELTVKEGDKVEILIDNKTDLGVNVIINQKHHGLIFKNEIFQPLKLGEKHSAYIAKIHPDNKIDVSLQKSGLELLDDAAKIILQKLSENGGKLMLHDKSDPKEIATQLKMSKKAFKKAVGILYKQQSIVIHDTWIERADED